MYILLIDKDFYEVCLSCAELFYCVHNLPGTSSLLIGKNFDSFIPFLII
jgi:hypothetical protein